LAGRSSDGSGRDGLSGTSAEQLISSGYQGSVYLAGAAGERVIVKKTMGWLPARAVRRAMIRREYAVYQRLQGVAGVPRCYGLEHGEQLLLEYVEGHTFRNAAAELADREAFFAELLDVIRSLHRAGIAHSDLKRKDNILVTPSERPVLIDFGSAVILRDGAGPFNRFLFRQACRIDLNAWVKHKYRKRFDEISAADLPLYRPTFIEAGARAIRRVWRKLTGRRWRKARRMRRRQRH